MTGNIDYADIFTPVPQQTDEERKADWVERRKAEREETYALIDQTAMLISSDPELLQKYLNAQSQFDRYSTANALLVAAQHPGATRLGDFNRWKEDGVFVKRNEKGIAILEPGKEYDRDDGSTGVSYNVKRVFNISQTNSKAQKADPKPEINAVLKALVQASPVSIRVVDVPAGNRIASYLPEENAIEVAKGQDAADLVRCLSQEIAYASLVAWSNVPAIDPDPMSYCASYMVCKKLGVDTKGYVFHDICRSFDGLDAKGVRDALDGVRTVGTDIIGRVGHSLDRTKNAAVREAVR